MLRRASAAHAYALLERAADAAEPGTVADVLEALAAVAGIAGDVPDFAGACAALARNCGPAVSAAAAVRIAAVAERFPFLLAL